MDADVLRQVMIKKLSAPQNQIKEGSKQKGKGTFSLLEEVVKNKEQIDEEEAKVSDAIRESIIKSIDINRLNGLVQSLLK